ncbi:MAG TPA: hypothetical protein VG649_07520 [Candidatus Angelobacter sp.]|nr:hypothetical protein [Candidatus Angelobacter sp.]
MSHSYLCCLFHIVFTAAERRPWIRDEMRDRTVTYIRRPPEHHKRISFEEEFKRLLAAYGIQEE